MLNVLIALSLFISIACMQEREYVWIHTQYSLLYQQILEITKQENEDEKYKHK